MTDPLAPFFTVPLGVFRKIGDGSDGPLFAPSAAVLGRVVHETRLVRTASGEEMISASRVCLPIATPAIPVGSRVLLPDGRTAFVLAEQRHIAAPAFLPTYYSIDLT